MDDAEASCSDVDIGTVLNSAGWADCPAGAYMKGIRRGFGGEALDTLDTVRCCAPVSQMLSTCTVTTVNFTAGGSIGCDQSGDVISGIYRDSQSTIDGLTQLRCCSVMYNPPL